MPNYLRRTGPASERAMFHYPRRPKLWVFSEIPVPRQPASTVRPPPSTHPWSRSKDGPTEGAKHQALSAPE